MESIFGSDAPAALEGSAAPDPAKVEAAAAAVGKAARDLSDHVNARAAQSPNIAEEFRDLANVVRDLAKRFEPAPHGEAKQVGSVSDPEARLVEGLVRRVTEGRDHLELGYLRKLADDFSLAVAAAALV